MLHDRLDRLHAFAKAGIVDGHVAPAQHGQAFGRNGLFDDLARLSASRGLARHEELADCVMARPRQVEAELGAFGGEEPVRDLGQDAATVAERGVRPHRAAMVEVDQDLQALFENVVRLAILHVGDKTDAAGIMLPGRIVEALGGRRQRIATDMGILRFAGPVERRLGYGVHLSGPRAVADFVRPTFQIFKAYHGQRRLRDAQLEGVTRRIFFDPSLSFDTTTLEPRSSAGAEALASSHKKWSAQLSYYSHDDRNGSPTQAVGAQLFVASIRRDCELPARRELTQIVRSSSTGASMNFASDNGAGVAPEILDAIVASSRVNAPAYGADDYTAKAQARLRDVFETEVAAFLVATGTAANALALSALVKPWDAVFCHEEAHIHDDECGAPELFTGGAKLVGIAGEGGKITAHGLKETLERFPRGLVKSSQPGALSLSQATEAGTVYSVSEVSELSSIAHRNGIGVHMDGARFANALVSAKATPAEMTWRAGVDILTLGATKNGALACEAVMFFDPSRAENFAFQRKRGGQTLSKGRFLGAQMRGLSRRWAVVAVGGTRKQFRPPACPRPCSDAGRADRVADRGQRGLCRRAERVDRAMARGRRAASRVDHAIAGAGECAANGRNSGEAGDVVRNRVNRN